MCNCVVYNHLLYTLFFTFIDTEIKATLSQNAAGTEYKCSIILLRRRVALTNSVIITAMNYDNDVNIYNEVYCADQRTLQIIIVNGSARVMVQNA